MKGLSVAGLVAILSSGTAFAEGIVEPGARLEKIADGFVFTEGPATDQDGNIYFTDQPNDRIHKWTAADNKVTVFLEPSGRSNGLTFDQKGRLVACADEKNELWLVSLANKTHTVLVKGYESKLLNGPNDAWVRPDGGIYFTDPFYKRPYWQRGAMEQDGQHVYFLSANGKALSRAATGLVQPNGIVGTPDGRTLFVADIGDNKTYRYDIQADGSLSNRALFCNLGSDGMALDSAGNLYLTGKGVTVFDRAGQQIDHIDVPEAWTGNVAFGGKDLKLLFITASKGVYGIRTRVTGIR